jgi:pyruvate/2-oxoglutarate/acetoin dehydrogenase E1 component
MVQAAGMYNALLQSDEPGLIIECLNGYRLKETKPDNLEDYTVELGQPEVMQEGTDITLVTYGSTLRIVQDAMQMLEDADISCELVDVQTLIPFDKEHKIVESLKKTNRIAFIDEDMPGGTTAFLMRQILEVQNGYFWLDSQPVTVTAAPNRSAFASDGDYFCKPNAEDIFEQVYALMRESDPNRFPPFYQ